MNQVVSTVKTQEGGEWDYTMPNPESFDEAVEIYGEEAAFAVFLGGLKIKLDNAARDAFRSGKAREEVEEIVAAYRPGGPSRKNVKARALELLTTNAVRLQSDTDLMGKVRDAFTSGKFKDVVALLSDEPQEEEAIEE